MSQGRSGAGADVGVGAAGVGAAGADIATGGCGADAGVGAGGWRGDHLLDGCRRGMLLHRTAGGIRQEPGDGEYQRRDDDDHH